MMKAFFSRRKDGGKSHSDSSLYPPPSLAPRRTKMIATDALDLASAASPASTVSSSASAPWDGKCTHCRKLMSRCLCHEDTAGSSHGRPRHEVADQYSAIDHSDRIAEDASTPTNDKRFLLETLSGMHPSRARARVPLKMTQDRSRDRRLRESQRLPKHTLLSSSPSPSPLPSSSSSSSEPFAPTRSVGLTSKSSRHIVVGVEHDDEDSSSSLPSRFTRSCPDVKWRSSSAITSTMRLAHDRDVLPPRSGPPKNLLAYDNKKTTTRYNHAHSTASAGTTRTTATSTSTPPLATAKARASSAVRTPSGNLYITEPVARRRRDNDGNEDFSRVWEL